jgi:hypothetical protein
MIKIIVKGIKEVIQALEQFREHTEKLRRIK